MNLLRERVPIQVIFHYGVRMTMRYQRQTFFEPVIRKTRTLFFKSTSVWKKLFVWRILK